ncbi:gustatory receptor for sugar taste 43a isoform X3 [Nilaparvata lugens]|uniref:gustatory receptor for sugar taste 43a isoform X3 n=1 Tax=Nilaparvata lugens TaxID=108931 RepID=UPI00193E60E0|nr:gustatory receptor for sugar taste 43a isoform X3 [Nilaparvata lugens]
MEMSMCIKERFKTLNRELESIVRRVNSKSRIPSTFLVGLPTVETSRISDVSDQQATIAMMSDIHWLLCDMVEKANDLFGAQVLALMICIFIHNIVTPYFFFLNLMYPKDSSIMSTLQLVSQFFWIITHVLELLVIVLPCAATSSELETFALQLTHHRAEYSAYGMFKLDLPVITSIAGAVTTYLVILIQFQGTDLDVTVVQT